MCIFAAMNDCTITPSIDDIDAYSIDMDSMCVAHDYDVADEFQYEIEEIEKSETDILFE